MPRKTFAQAAWQIVLADVSMSLDNVLAVAGAARDHPVALVFGLGLSIVLMGIAASFIARLLNRHRWIAYIGLAIILYVALDMIWRGALEIQAHAFPSGSSSHSRPRLRGDRLQREFRAEIAKVVGLLSWRPG